MIHFLLENEAYAYGEIDFSAEDFFQKKKLLKFFNRLGYLTGVVPLTETNKKL